MSRHLQYLMTVMMCFGMFSSEMTDNEFCDKCQCQDSDVICNNIGQLSFLQNYNGKDVQCLIITGGVQEEESENEFEEFSSISELYLQFGDLHNNPHIFRPLSDVILMDLRSNSLTEIDSQMFVNNKRLVNLDLRDNKISDIESNAFVSLKELTMLNLSGNTLETLKDDTFAGLSTLTLLDLSRNRLRSVSGALLAPLEFLEEIHLEKNALSSIGSDLARQLARPGLETTLGANPFVCTCDSLGAAFTTYKSYTAVTGTLLDIFCDGDDNKPWVTVMSTLDCATTVNNGEDNVDAGDEKAGLKPVPSSSASENKQSEKERVVTEKIGDAGSKPVNPTSEAQNDSALNMPSLEDGSRAGELPASDSNDALAQLVKEMDLVHDDAVVLETEYDVQRVVLISLICVISIVSTILAAVMIVLYVKQSQKVNVSRRSSLQDCERDLQKGPLIQK